MSGAALYWPRSNTLVGRAHCVDVDLRGFQWAVVFYSQPLKKSRIRDSNLNRRCINRAAGPQRRAPARCERFTHASIVPTAHPRAYPHGALTERSAV
jgi:hypothetical protein